MSRAIAGLDQNSSFRPNGSKEITIMSDIDYFISNRYQTSSCITFDQKEESIHNISSSRRRLDTRAGVQIRIFAAPLIHRKTGGRK